MLIGIISLAVPAMSMACPDGQQEVCAIVCVCLPRPVQERLTQISAQALQEWIVQSRNAAANDGTQSIPSNIRNKLAKYYDDRVLNTARYKVGDNGTLNAAKTMFQNPDVNAVTLIDIIVFRYPADAANNLALWAHELKHVQQYLDWGVRDFASRYIRDFKAIEDPAYEIQNTVTNTPPIPQQRSSP